MSEAPAPFDGRLARLRAAMASAGIDALAVNYGPDFTWLTGFNKPVVYDVGKGQGDWVNVMLVPLERAPVVFINPSWGMDISSHLWVEDIRLRPLDQDPDAWLAGELASLALAGKTIAATKTLWAQTLLSLQSGESSARFVPASNAFMDRVRSIKDGQEIALLEQAARITDLAFGSVVDRMRIGMTERELLAELDYQILRHGGAGHSFQPTIVVDGHGERRAVNAVQRDADRPLRSGATVAFDFGVVYESYCSDFGRSVFIGKPDPEALAAWQSITRADQRAVAQMGAGMMTPQGIHDLVVESVTEDGFRDQFSWYALGHAIGLDVHEDPWMQPPFGDPIEAGMVFALEPKIGRPGKFYVRCEDVVAVEDSGGRALTTFSYDPIIIG